MAASAVEPRGVVAVYFWGCRPQPPPRPPWVTLLAPSFRRPRSPPRVSSTPPPPPLAPTVPFWWGVGFSKRWGKISLLLSPTDRILSFSFFVASPPRARALAEATAATPDDTPVDDDSVDYRNLALSSRLRRRCAGRRGPRGMFRGRRASRDESRRCVSPRRMIAVQDWHHGSNDDFDHTITLLQIIWMDGWQDTGTQCDIYAGSCRASSFNGDATHVKNIFLEYTFREPFKSYHELLVTTSLPFLSSVLQFPFKPLSMFFSLCSSAILFFFNCLHRGDGLYHS